MNPLATTADPPAPDLLCEGAPSAADDRQPVTYGPYVFKRLDTPDEVEQVHRLNHRTFVRELRQYSAPDSERLVDKFHEKNQYFVALRDQRVVGMISAHDRPPFSICARLSDPGIVSRPGMRPLEVRLLAVDPGQRKGTVFAGLVWTLHRYARRGSYTHILISGVQERQALYARLGFVPLGSAVRSGESFFIPMMLDLQSLPGGIRRDVQLWERRLGLRDRPKTVCLLPGPVEPAPEVREAFGRPPISHRSREFVTLFQRVRSNLRELTQAHRVALFNGSGSLANDIVAANLAADESLAGRGLILVNGEFGQRLCGQAERFGLSHDALRWPWGTPWNHDQVEAALAARPAWVWATHLETSTGMLNDLAELVRSASAHHVPVCVDCISSLGAVPLDLKGVHLATGTSGKSLGAYAGVAVVFASDRALNHAASHRLPAYFDLPETVATVGPRFTFPSSPVMALEAALRAYASPEHAQARYEHHAAMGRFVREQLRGAGVQPLTEEPHAAPVCTTFDPFGGMSAEAFVAQCRDWGFEVAGNSAYLAERGWVQIATMGHMTKDECRPLFRRLRRWSG